MALKTYGQLTLQPSGRGRWTIQNLEPHVMIAFKRLFPRVAKTAVNLTLDDSDEIRADLHWFMQRYPLQHSEAQALDEGRARIAARMAERDRVLLPSWTPGAVTGFKDGHQPYGYQSAAAQIALSFGALLLGDDVGLGKTISAAATFAMGAPLPAAVVVQPHLAGQWKKQIEKFTHLRAHVIAGTTPYDLPPADIYIFRYSNVAGWLPIITQGVFKSVAYDEIQELRKGTETNKGRAAYHLSLHAQLRLGLTATPVYNYGDEMHRVLGFLKPDLLGGRDEFLREWCGGTVRVSDPDALGSYLRDTGYFLRRTEDDPAVLATLPPANVLEWEVAYDDAAASADIDLTRKLALTVLRGSFAEAGQAARELDMRMRQLTGIGKARAVAAYVRMLLQDADRVLLAGWHREVYSIWQEELADFSPVLYTGSETAAGKARNVEAFTTGDARVMMISLRSGAGLDGLQFHCNEVVFGELDWSPQVHHQVTGRLRRPGQERQVNVHYLHTNEGSDPVLLETLGIKADQSRGINDPGQAAKPRFSDDSRIRRLAEHVLGSGLSKDEAA